MEAQPCTMKRTSMRSFLNLSFMLPPTVVESRPWMHNILNNPNFPSSSSSMVMNPMKNQVPKEVKKEEGGIPSFGVWIKPPPESLSGIHFSVVENHEISNSTKNFGIKNYSRVIKKRSTNPIKIENAESSRKANGFKLFGAWIECPEPLNAEQEAKENKKDEKPAGEDRNQGDLGICLGEKKLTASDVDKSCRLLMGKSIEVNRVMPFLNEEVAIRCNNVLGCSMKVWDLDTKTEHSLALRKWVTNYFIFNKGWKKDFVDRRNLQKDDVIRLYWDVAASRFNFCVVSRNQS